MSVEKAVEERAVRAKMASRQLVHHSSEQRSVALCRAAELLGMRRSKIMRANAIDLEGAQSKALSAAMIDRLTITDARIEDMANGLREVAAQDDPVGRVLEEWTRPNGLQIQKVSVPLGVVGIIYESRPNVTIDAAGLCLKSGNACLLRGGSEAINSNLALAAVQSVNSVGNQVHDDGPYLRRVGENDTGCGVKIFGQGDGLGQHGTGQSHRLLYDYVDIDVIAFNLCPEAEGKDLVHQIPGPLTGLNDHLHVFPFLGRPGKGLKSLRAQAQYGEKQVVEIVSDAAGQAAQGFHILVAQQFRFHALAIGNVLGRTASAFEGPGLPVKYRQATDQKDTRPPVTILRLKDKIAKRRPPTRTQLSTRIGGECSKVAESAAHEFVGMKIENFEYAIRDVGQPMAAVNLPHPVRNQSRQVVEAALEHRCPVLSRE